MSEEGKLSESIGKRIVNQYPCNCDAGYKDRGLKDPHCVRCEIEGLDEEIDKALAAARREGFEAARLGGRTPPSWDMNWKYQTIEDYERSLK